jgi:hypothetical protein
LSKQTVTVLLPLSNRVVFEKSFKSFLEAGIEELKNSEEIINMSKSENNNFGNITIDLIQSKSLPPNRTRRVYVKSKDQETLLVKIDENVDANLTEIEEVKKKKKKNKS